MGGAGQVVLAASLLVQPRAGVLVGPDGRGTRRRDLLEDVALVRGVPLDGLDQVGDEVVAPLHCTSTPDQEASIPARCATKRL